MQSQTPSRLAPAEICLRANRDLSLGAPLPRVAARFRSGDPVTVVAIGSSSTVGLWVLKRDRTFPGVTRRELARLRPNSRLAVVNSGRIGDTIPGNVARFRRDVFRYRPDLVIWQVGTNDVVWGGRTDGLKAWLVHGVRALKARGADVVLMDLQYAPIVLASSQHARMQAITAQTARQERVGLFSRFSLMRRAREAGAPPGALVSLDGLHNSAAGYDCIGRALARAIDAAAR